MKSTTTEYTETKTIKVGNCTVVIYRPKLTLEERTIRERAVETALAKYGRAAAAVGK